MSKNSKFEPTFKGTGTDNRPLYIGAALNCVLVQIFQAASSINYKSKFSIREKTHGITANLKEVF